MEHIISQDGPVWQGARRGYGQLMRLAGSMLRIGAIGFGGGNALIPVIEAEVVQRGQLVTKRDYEEDVIAACITPGALPVEIAAGIGQRLGGFPGMLLAAAMMALPGALLTVLILSVLTGEQGAALQGIRYVSLGLGAFIVSLLLAYVLKTLAATQQAGARTFRAMCLVMLAVFLLSSEKNLYALLGWQMVPLFNLSVLSVLGLSFFLIAFLGKGCSRSNIVLSGGLALLFLLSGSHMASFFPLLCMKPSVSSWQSWDCVLSSAVSSWADRLAASGISCRLPAVKVLSGWHLRLCCPCRPCC